MTRRGRWRGCPFEVLLIPGAFVMHGLERVVEVALTLPSGRIAVRQFVVLRATERTVGLIADAWAEQQLAGQAAELRL